MSVHPDSASAAIIEGLRLQAVALAFDRLHPGLAYRVEMVETLPPCRMAATDFGGADGVPVVGLLRGQPEVKQHEWFAHELAHVAAGFAAEHGEEWEATQEAIHLAAAAVVVPGAPDHWRTER